MIGFVRDNMAPLMFLGLIVFMLIGYPAAFSLAAVGLFFAFIGIELGLIEPNFLGNLTYQLFGIVSNDPRARCSWPFPFSLSWAQCWSAAGSPRTCSTPSDNSSARCAAASPTR
jgi:hypothetical protein